jgi:hypothetical protein
MPVPHHADLELMPGDDWVIPFVLTDVNGSPLDLTNATLQFTLLDPDGNKTIVDPLITIDEPKTKGTGAIAVNNTVTTNLSPGRYTDALRVTIADAQSTVWLGLILVDADPFALPPPPPPPPPVVDAVVVVPPWWWFYGRPYY